NYYTSNGLSGSQVFDIKEGKEGTIYFATYGKGVTILKDDSLIIINEENGLLSNWVTRVLVRLNGDVIFAAEKGDLSAIRNNKIINWQNEIGFGNSSVWGLYESKDSTLYIGSYKLFRYKDNVLDEFAHTDSYSSKISLQAIYAIEEDNEGRLFVGTLNGIHELVNGKLQKLKVDGKKYNNSAVSILTAKDGTIYFCSENGVIVKQNENFEFLRKEHGLADSDVWSVFEDSNGIIYFGTRDQGVSIYYPNRIETYRNSKITGNSITAINKDDDDKLFFGTPSGLFINRDGVISSILKNRTINTIEIGNEKIFVGTNEGFHVLQNGILKNYNLVPNPSALNKVWSIVSTDEDEVLIGFQGGLYIFNKDKLTNLSSQKVHNQYIQDMLLLSDSTLIIGTHGNGVSFYKGGNEINFTTENGLSNNIVNCLHQTSENLILVGTDQGGLNVIQNYIILKNFTIDDGLMSNTVKDINEDSKGNIYLSTSNGINILNNIMDSLTLRTITRNDGLVSNSCNINATYIDKKGIIWIGTSKGISKYNPNADKPIKSPPNIYITELEIFNKKYPLKKLKKDNGLNYDQNYLKFIYTGINLSAPDKILYKYRLSGVDHKWVESKNNNVQYTSLDDGNYTFEVQARNEWGYWSNPTSLSFVINHAWWETWWFRLTIISVLGFMLWLAFQYRLSYLLKLERLRTKIASDLHDEVGSLLTQISVNADSLSYTKDEDKRKEKSSFIRAKSSEVINMMSDVIWSIDSRNDNLESLVDRIHNFAQSFLEQKDIALNLSSDIQNLQKTLKIDFRQNIMLIAKEAINNSVKYSDCSKIDIIINYKNDNFELLISDNGKGFEMQNLKKGNGLKNMKMRAKSIGADIHFKNENGFSIRLTKTKL
ncbi:MAG: hypothetical protein KDC52_10930, partial [Ignavibacteriae bacterium]|nr:hypothetical protein [Ignavibacteriota bacterium]